jgi:hypothetical protein
MPEKSPEYHSFEATPQGGDVFKADVGGEAPVSSSVPIETGAVGGDVTKNETPVAGLDAVTFTGTAANDKKAPESRRVPATPGERLKLLDLAETDKQAMRDSLSELAKNAQAELKAMQQHAKDLQEGKKKPEDAEPFHHEAFTKLAETMAKLARAGIVLEDKKKLDSKTGEERMSNTVETITDTLAKGIIIVRNGGDMAEYAKYRTNLNYLASKYATKTEEHVGSEVVKGKNFNKVERLMYTDADFQYDKPDLDNAEKDMMIAAEAEERQTGVLNEAGDNYLKFLMHRQNLNRGETSWEVPAEGKKVVERMLKNTSDIAPDTYGLRVARAKLVGITPHLPKSEAQITEELIAWGTKALEPKKGEPNPRQAARLFKIAANLEPEKPIYFSEKERQQLLDSTSTYRNDSASMLSYVSDLKAFEKGSYLMAPEPQSETVDETVDEPAGATVKSINEPPPVVREALLTPEQQAADEAKKAEQKAQADAEKVLFAAEQTYTAQLEQTPDIDEEMQRLLDTEEPTYDSTADQRKIEVSKQKGEMKRESLRLLKKYREFTRVNKKGDPVMKNVPEALGHLFDDMTDHFTQEETFDFNDSSVGTMKMSLGMHRYWNAADQVLRRIHKTMNTKSGLWGSRKQKKAAA